MPAVEELRPDEPGVAFENCWLDLLQLLSRTGELRGNPLFVLFGRVLLGSVRFSEEFEIGPMTAVAMQRDLCSALRDSP